jgi:hypothetical protein
MRQRALEIIPVRAGFPRQEMCGAGKYGLSANPDMPNANPCRRSGEPNGVILFQSEKDNVMPTARPTINITKCVLSSGLLIAVLCPCIAAAALGQPETSVQTDMARLRGSITVTPHANYKLHEIQMPSGTLVREFAGSDGKVFAVAWNGPTVPNLREILGQYFDSYVTAAKAPHSGHHHLQIRQSDLVVLAGGHMRAFSGLAYLPQALPSGVGVGDLH